MAAFSDVFWERDYESAKLLLPYVKLTIDQIITYFDYTSDTKLKKMLIDKINICENNDICKKYNKFIFFVGYSFGPNMTIKINRMLENLNFDDKNKVINAFMAYHKPTYNVFLKDILSPDILYYIGNHNITKITKKYKNLDDFIKYLETDTDTEFDEYNVKNMGEAH